MKSRGHSRRFSKRKLFFNPLDQPAELTEVVQLFPRGPIIEIVQLFEDPRDVAPHLLPLAVRKGANRARRPGNGEGLGQPFRRLLIKVLFPLPDIRDFDLVDRLVAVRSGNFEIDDHDFASETECDESSRFLRRVVSLVVSEADETEVRRDAFEDGQDGLSSFEFARVKYWVFRRGASVRGCRLCEGEEEGLGRGRL